jgi:hypothetical protein
MKEIGCVYNPIAGSLTLWATNEFPLSVQLRLPDDFGEERLAKLTEVLKELYRDYVERVETSNK